MWLWSQRHTNTLTCFLGLWSNHLHYGIQILGKVYSYEYLTSVIFNFLKKCIFLEISPSLCFYKPAVSVKENFKKAIGLKLQEVSWKSQNRVLEKICDGYYYVQLRKWRRRQVTGNDFIQPSFYKMSMYSSSSFFLLVTHK